MTVSSLLRAPPGAGAERRMTLVAIAAVFGLSLVFLYDTPVGRAGIDRDGDLLGIALIAAMLVPLAWWRTAPLKALVIPVLAALVTVVVGYAAGLAQLTVYCAVGAAAWGTEGRNAALLGLAGAVVVAIVFTDDDFGGVSALNLVVGAGLGALPAGVGHALRVQQTSAQRARDHAVRLERLQELELRRAIAEERVRIARDVHDVVGHHLSAIKLQSGAARRTLGRDPDTAAAAVEAIGSSASEALGETRRMLGLLREDGAELQPTPRADALGGLLDVARQAGIDARLDVRGEPGDLPEVVQSTAYRIVQEALTNVAKHVGPTTVHVAVDATPGRLRLVVRDEGSRSHRDLSTSVGHGLLGMRERVALVGGTLSAGPDPAGGWRVAADLPASLEP